MDGDLVTFNGSSMGLNVEFLWCDGDSIMTFFWGIQTLKLMTHSRFDWVLMGVWYDFMVIYWIFDGDLVVARYFPRFLSMKVWENLKQHMNTLWSFCRYVVILIHFTGVWTNFCIVQASSSVATIRIYITPRKFKIYGICDWMSHWIGIDAWLLRRKHAAFDEN